MYKSHKYTKLIKRDTPRRLGGDLDLHRAEKEHIIDSEGNYPADYHTFMEIDKRKVVSPVYIVGNQSDILRGKISENVFGKAVVFVSGNKSLNPNDLA
jgi:hypothetical protein